MFAGNSANNNNNDDIVEANMYILRERIEEIKIKELRAFYEGGEEENYYGWNYETEYDENRHKRLLLAKSFEVVSSIGGSFGFVFIGGSFLIYLLSLLLHTQN